MPDILFPRRAAAARRHWLANALAVTSQPLQVAAFVSVSALERAVSGIGAGSLERLVNSLLK